MSLFCSSAHPLVIFLDDLQWIDFATVSLLEWLFCNQNISHCLFIGAFRDNEVDSTHRIAQMIRHLQKQKSAPLSIKLKPLSRSDITELIADTLHHTQNNVLDLADIVIKQTEGNPFYVESLLTERYQEHLIWFNTTTQSWDWDCQQIEQCPVSEDVVDLMIRKMERLAPESQRLLSIASCIGNRFSVAFLAHLSELDAPLVHHAVQEALSLGFLVSYQKPPSNEEDLSHETTISDGYRFAHDKIQQAAFSLIPKKEYPAIHTRIGRALLSSYHPDVSTEFVFNMVNHLNAGDLSLLNAQQQADLIELNREAGDRAMRVSAFDAGLDYFRQALELAIQQKLPWWQNPTHQVQLYTELAQAAYMCTHFDDMEHYCQSVIALTPDIEQLIPVYELQIQAHTSLNHLSDALELALMVLEKLGEPFPPTPVDSDFEQARHEVERLLEGRSVADLANLPDMTDPRKLAAMRILSSASGAALCKRAALHPLFVARRILLSLNFGHAPETTFAYASFGLVLVAKLRDYELAWQFSQLCYATQHRFPDKKLNNRANYVSIMSVEHWKRPLRECTTRLQECYRVAVELGDSDFVGFTAYNLGYQLFPCASGLEEFTSNLTALMTTLVKLKQIRWNNLLAMLQFTAHQLTGEETSRSITDHFGQEQVDQWYASQGEEALIFALHTNQLIVDLHYGRVQPAWEAANQAHAALCYEVQALRALPLFQFYEGVCHFLRLLESPAPLSASPDTQITADFLQHCRTHFDQLRQMCPDNHHHHFLIFKAACQWLQKEQKQAIELLSQACQFAIRMQYWGDAGLICQIQARCYQSLRYEDEAAESLAQASQYYTEWGATGVVKALDQTAFLPSPSNVVPPRNPQSKTGTPGSQDPLHQAPSPQNLDYETVIQVLQQISSTISLKPLIELLLTAMLENAGAQRVVLLIGDKELLDVYGALDVKTEVSHPFPCALESYSALPQNLIRFVARTRDYVRMDDVRIEGRKYRDSYLDQSHLRSALCLPIIREERAIGVVYFENNASTAIFTDQRIQVLSLIASQAAISIENARLLDEQKQIKLDLQSALDKNRALLSAIPDLIFLFDRRCTFLDCHPKQKMALHFRDPDHIIGKQVDEVLSPSQAQLVHRAVNEVLGSEQPATYSFSVQLRDETAHYESRFAQCGEELVLVIVRDITDRVHAAEEHERLQGQLMLTNKMESVGRLAGGIAHDFNNLLGIIFGYIDLSMVSTQEKKVSEYLEKTSQAIDRAKHLTAQLLTFSKGGTPVKKKAALIPFIHDTIEFALSGSAVSCDFEIQEHLDCCEYDENLLAQVLDNIVINASQAMQGKGRIEVRAANEHLESSYSNELPAGEYVRISLRDSGAGMERKVMDKIFDPFFTTKPTGHGLGLATCYSIIRQHHGLIEVESTPGKGTTFHLLLPACHERETTLESTSQHDHTGKGTIVIMDDEEAILDVIGQMVESFGYHAVLKKEGAEVMHYIETCPHRDEIKGMIFDLTIPGKMGGLETIAAIRKLDTTLPVFVASGYADDPAMSNPAEYGFTASIRKPFVTQDLARLFNAAGVT
jgi:predicted ATPase/signal transduction histidine kinase/CheY-like chemotaxis protein